LIQPSPNLYSLTSVDLVAVHDQVVDVTVDLNESFVLLSILVLSHLHQVSYVLREEVRLQSVDHIEQILSVDTLHLSLAINR
jgi:hypothetical protein